ncbi:MAG: aspartate kinase [Firmicutes bacterium]|nr:aspartate kinase [Bacillota bacterium]
MLKVAKFGGSSVADAAQFKKVKKIVNSDEARRVIVVSAAGKRSSDDYKMTDLLYLLQAHLKYGVSGAEIIKTLRDRFTEIRDGLGIDYPIEKIYDQFAKGLSKETPVDEIVSRGEFFTSHLMAEYLGFTFVDAADVIFFGYDGKLDTEKTYESIENAVNQYGKVVIPGFYGSLPNGKIKVMTRGGSDITGSLAAASIKADVYENWTDVSGILMADPKIVKNPNAIVNITYNELQELATMGASVLHEDAVAPVREAGIPLNIRNTNKPKDRGTMILEEVKDDPKGTDKWITGLSGKKNFTILTIKKNHIENTFPFRHSLKILDRYGIPAEHVTIGLNSFSFVVPSDILDDRLYDVLTAIKEESQADDIQVQDKIAMVAIVSRKMGFKPGFSGMLFSALGDNKVNVRTIKQSADELSIVIGVANEDFEKAIRVLYEKFAG